MSTPRLTAVDRLHIRAALVVAIESEECRLEAWAHVDDAGGKGARDSAAANLALWRALIEKLRAK